MATGGLLDTELTPEQRDYYMADPKNKNMWFGLLIASAGFMVFILGSSLTRKGALGALNPLAVFTYALFTTGMLAACYWVGTQWWGEYQKWLRTDPLTIGEGKTDQEMPPGMEHGPNEAMGNPDVIRLGSILTDAGLEFTANWDEWEFDAENNNAVVAYSFSFAPGVMSSTSTQNKAFERLNQGLGQGWAINIDPQTDMITGTKKSEVPTLAPPEIWPVVRSTDEASGRFNKLEISIGLSANGPITFKPKNFPHLLLVGATGGGKSVAARSIIEEYLAAGYRLFAMDGKGTDYAPYFTHQNFSAISTNLREHIILIHKVWLILQGRRARGTELSKQGDTSWRTKLTPVLIVLDEFASFRNNLKAEFKADEIKLVDRDIADLLKVGREFRVNVMLATQDLRADTLKTDWLSMFPMKISAGQPDKMTISKAFPEEIQSEVTRVGQSISRNTPGRSLVAVTDEDGTNHVELFQAYWSYTPAESLEQVPDVMKPNWTQFKAEVTDAVPRMYPREWVKLLYPDPDPDAKKDPFSKLRESEDGFVDLSEFSVSDLHKLRPIRLEDENFIPIPENMIYDPLRDEYLGNKPASQQDNFDIIDI